jgi:hypothetical protein
MAHFNSPAFDPGFIKPAPLRIAARLHMAGAWARHQAKNLYRWYQGAGFNGRFERQAAARWRAGTRPYRHKPQC